MNKTWGLAARAGTPKVKKAKATDAMSEQGNTKYDKRLYSTPYTCEPLRTHEEKDWEYGSLIASWSEMSKFINHISVLRSFSQTWFLKIALFTLLRKSARTTSSWKVQVPNWQPAARASVHIANPLSKCHKKWPKDAETNSGWSQCLCANLQCPRALVTSEHIIYPIVLLACH